ncbi:MAG TPA: ABC transporter ATP-binding protein [Dehalococcoidia bacterium]|nr:ABC transporter ATP-binding protein [Dehalococcoidia bacterium]
MNTTFRWPTMNPATGPASATLAIEAANVLGEADKVATDSNISTAQSVIPLLRMEGITRAFPSVIANDRVDLEVYGGEVHAVLGENGAGKSTLMKIIYGFYQPDSGTISVNGIKTPILSPNDSRRLGIGMVFQQFALIPALTVAENVALFLPHQGLIVSRRLLRERINETCARYDLQVNPDARVSDLSMGERQKVELIKLILARARVLIFDEPTSVLAPHEIDGLFQVFNELKLDGYAILFITHKMREVMTIADRVTVLRHGKVVSTALRNEVTADGLISQMLGIETPQSVRNTSVRQNGAVGAALEFRNVSTGGIKDRLGLSDVSFHVSPGEILGVAGVAGNGQQELGEVVLGLGSKNSGSVLLFGQVTDGWSVSRVVGSSVGYVPEDPLEMAVVPEMQVTENLALGELSTFNGRSIWLNWRLVREKIAAQLEKFPLALARHEARVRQLSGGNIQRVVLARELGRNPKVLIAYYPTRGLDVLTAETTRRLLMDSRAKGAAILLVSEDLDELLALSDRLIVMHQGRVVGQFHPHTASVHEIGQLMTGLLV